VVPGRFDYLDPATVEEAVAHLEARADADVKVLAGGQSLIPLMRLRFARPECLVDINRIRELRRLRLEGGALRIGATVREAELEADPAVRRAFPILHDATRVIADPVVRNLATVGGNLAHGDPANDHPAVMVALEAEIAIRGGGGERTVPAAEFFVDLYETALEPTELLSEIRVPAQPAGSAAAYVKFERQAGDFAIAAVAARVTVDGGAVADARLVYTNVGATPLRTEQAERTLLGGPVSQAAARAAGVAAAETLDLDDDLRGSAAYKRRVVVAVTERALRLAAARAGGAEAA
jgi:aerobic carbon-monoxide dehydrogenase medium subunit